MSGFLPSVARDVLAILASIKKKPRAKILVKEPDEEVETISEVEADITE